MNHFDTIAAIATPPGTGGIAVIRVSGKDAFAIVQRCFQKKLSEVESHRIVFGHIADDEGAKIDEVLVSVFRAPHSFTGENTAEISCHGGYAVTHMVLNRILQCGARLAQGGEFTKRAFLNGKMDLSQAEAVIDIINAESALSVYAGENQLFGCLKNKVEEIRGQVLDVISSILAVIDYPDEDISEMKQEDILHSLREAKEKTEQLTRTYQTGKILRQGAKIVIAGKPNVGKSSLLNAMLKENRAIVTDIPGTTRDILEETLDIGGLKVQILDTAGIRESGDRVEAIGIERAVEHIRSADLVLFLADRSRPLSAEDFRLMKEIKDKKAFLLLNKKDVEARMDAAELKSYLPDKPVYAISAKNFEGINELTDDIRKAILEGEIPKKDALYLTNQRHYEALSGCAVHLEAAISDLEKGIYPDIVTIELENAVQSLGEVTGMTVSEEVIGNIFAKFCVGK